MKETYKLFREYVKDKVILDVGCGEGYVDLYLSEVARHVTGIDVNKKVVNDANRRFSGRNINFYEMSGENLKFPANLFDVVVSSVAIEHMKNEEKFLAEVSRVLKNNGIFICTAPNKLSIVPPGEKIYDTPFYPFHLREYMPDQFYGLLAKYFKVHKKACFYNPDRNLKLITSSRYKLIYRMSRFGIIRWLGRNLSLRVKEFFFFFKQIELKSEDLGTFLCDYHNNLKIIPEVLCAICIKLEDGLKEKVNRDDCL